MAAHYNPSNPAERAALGYLVAYAYLLMANHLAVAVPTDDR